MKINSNNFIENSAIIIEFSTSILHLKIDDSKFNFVLDSSSVNG